jgi:hypothetical protein
MTFAEKQEQPQRQIPLRRIRGYNLDVRDLQDLLLLGFPLWFPWDARIVGCRIVDDCVCLKVHSETFAAVPEGEKFPFFCWPTR